MKKFSEYFQLNKSQTELDFVDVYLNTDLPLFLDSAYLGSRHDEFSQNASQTVRSFFDHLLSLISNNQIDKAREIFQNFEEPNETRLGLSKGKPQGRGVGREKSERIFNNILKSPASQTGLLEDLEDCYIFVENFGPDNLSDMITNIIKMDLIKYSQEQAKLWNIPLSPGITSGQYWDSVNNQWTETYTEMILCESKKIILVPKNIVVRGSSYNPFYYHTHFVLEFLRSRNLSLLTPLVEKKILKSGKEVISLSKKAIKTNENIIHNENGYNICTSPGDKNNLSSFSTAFPQIFKKFKTECLNQILSDSKVLDLNLGIEAVAKILLEQILEIPPGPAHAGRFHNWSIGVFELLFQGELHNPIKENEIHEGRKRIDIRFSNYATSGIFWKLPNIDKIPCTYLYIECKNYTNEISNPELDQMGGRFSDKKGKVGIIHCRTLDDKKLFTKRCADTFKDGRGLIIFLTDEDLNEALMHIAMKTQRNIYKIIEDRIDEIRNT